MPGEGQQGAELPDRAAAVARFAATARACRKAKRLTQEDVSYRSGLHVAEVSRLERGLRDPQLWTIVRLARGLGVEPAELLRELRGGVGQR
jgi:transcriptional regulator with XRE-family HTH domain